MKKLNYFSMKMIVYIGIIILCFSCGRENINEENNSIEGIWLVTEKGGVDSNFNKWNFMSDGTFCELKYIDDSQENESCDETGTWKLKNNKLHIEILEENGTKYGKPQKLKFRISNNGNRFNLKILKDKNDFGVNIEEGELILSRE